MDGTVKGRAGQVGGTRGSGLLTLPNLLSLSRVALTVVFVLLMVRQRFWAAFFVFLAAGATDALDGFTARVFRLRSTLGVWLDPIGDKILLTAGFVVLTLPALARPNTLPLWLTVLCISRDVAISLGAIVLIVLRGKRTFRPVLAGKASTVCQVLLLYSVLFANASGRSPGALSWFYVLTALLTAVSWIRYGFVGLAMLRGGRSAGSG